MSSTKLISAAALMLLLSLVCPAQDKSTGTLKGKVRVEKGSPAGVAAILLQGEREVARATTDKKGEFVLAQVTPGTYRVTLRKPCLVVGTIDDIEVKAGKTRNLGDHLVLGVDEGCVTFIRGSVFNDGGRSVPNVRVELARVIDDQSTEKLDSRITGETGEFVFRLSPDTGKYRLTVKTSGAQVDSKDVTIDGPAVYRVSLSYKPLPK